MKCRKQVQHYVDVRYPKGPMVFDPNDKVINEDKEDKTETEKEA